jgi:hypothetical protein
MKAKRIKVFEAMNKIIQECIDFAYIDAIWGNTMTSDEISLLDEMMDIFPDKLNLISDYMVNDFELFVKQMYKVYSDSYNFFVSIFASI